MDRTENSNNTPPEQTFQAEIGRLLHLLIHSLYSHSEIFLRELVSNASDALDKFKYLTLTDDRFKEASWTPEIQIKTDPLRKDILIISDNGIGMDKEDLQTSLGTIARSGTKNFLEKLSGDQKKDSSLIGQFGVGFYSVFMAASKVEVLSRKAGTDQSWKWISTGESGYRLEESLKTPESGQGTEITLYLNEKGQEYARRETIEQLIKKYSDHIAFPIFLHYTETPPPADAGTDEKKTPPAEPQVKKEQINQASAFWKKAKKDITKEEYEEFYKTFTGDFEAPHSFFHTRAEGTLEYTTLFFIPSKPSFDLYHADYKPGIKLYVNHVFITDQDKELFPPYLRFVKGIIDSSDLPLNVSRELLQKNKILKTIKDSSVKKLLGEFKKLGKDKEKYKAFIDQYNRLLKEGLYSDFAHREALLGLVRYKSSGAEGWVGLDDYITRMDPDAKHIYYLSGKNETTLRQSPLLEYYREKNIEVLLPDTEIDEIVLPMLSEYRGKTFKNINQEDISAEKTETSEALKTFLEKAKELLKDYVGNVVSSGRLKESPCCIVPDKNAPSFQMQAMMKQMGQAGPGLEEIKPILEINPEHEIIQKLTRLEEEELLENSVFLLFEQALLLEGLPLPKPGDFAEKMNGVLKKALEIQVETS